MSAKQAKRVSIRYTKKEFGTVGLSLILYGLMILFFPKVLLEFLQISEIFILEDEFLYYGIYYIILFFGTLVPFLCLKGSTNLTLGRLVKHTHMTFGELIVNTMVYFTAASLMIFFTMMVVNRFHIPGSVVSDIAVRIDGGDLRNAVYLLMFVILSPFLEEYAFRGVLLKTLDRYGKKFGVIVSALIYAFAHPSFIDMVPSFFMAIMLGLIVEHYHSLQPTIFIHITFNAFLVLLISVPASYSLYMTYGLASLYLISLILIVTRVYKVIHFGKSENNLYVYHLFFTNGFVIIAILLLILHSVLSLFI